MLRQAGEQGLCVCGGEPQGEGIKQQAAVCAFKCQQPGSTDGAQAAGQYGWSHEARQGSPACRGGWGLALFLSAASIIFCTLQDGERWPRGWVRGEVEPLRS